MDSQDAKKKEIRRVVIKGPAPEPEEIKKGQLVAVKAPPYYKKEYIYEITSAGDKLLRATLYHSPTVRKSWKQEEFMLLIEMGIVRLIGKEEIPAALPTESGTDD